ncbi:MAG: outer membrane protein assembly factor BamD [Geothrix sp.]|uniref:tetratricopeptide repeat protein n=1 Tax=Geothrix sp. TaxID=1962974 RepID=UPI00183B2CE2|nr:outer membrane protein assembly factor BamD [Geothrix sp.]NWJ42584.1 outer membrane protein assembly factor BamD [Geothrix sp.]WIL19456.1 MAG: outer membrane protein assembly factor BamD [Geothrix sp.]
MPGFTTRAFLAAVLLVGPISAGTGATIAPPRRQKTATLPKDPEAAYKLAATALLAANYAKAVDLFLANMKKFPKHPRMEDLQWGLAESYRGKGDTEMALAEYSRFYQDYGDAPRAAEALYKAGGCYEVLGDKMTAKLSYTVISRKFPTSAFAEQARTRLSELQSEPAK